MKRLFGVKALMVFFCFFIGFFSQMVLADRVVQVKLHDGTTYEFYYDYFDTGWSSTTLTEDWICYQHNLSYSNLDRVYWYGMNENFCNNHQDEWEFDVRLLDDSYVEPGYFPVAHDYVSGIIYGCPLYETCPTVNIDYEDINYIQFYDKACPGSWNEGDPSENFNDICYGNDLFVAVGENGVIWRLYGMNGTWSSVSLGSTALLRAVIYDGQQFLTVGNTGMVATSTDASTWTTLTSFTANNLHSVVYGNLLYVIVGNTGAIYTSSDLTNWTTRSSGVSDKLKDIIYANSMFVVVGANGRILTSTDGITWSQRTSGTTNFLYSVTWGDSQFVAVGDGGVILTSSDGISWTTRTSGTTQNLYGVTYSSDVNQFVAVGNNTALLKSTDGITWTVNSRGMTNKIFGVAYGDFGFIAAGEQIFVYRSCK